MSGTTQEWYNIRENERQNRRLSVLSRRKRPKERETYARRRERLRTRLRFSSDFASPPSFSPIEIRTRERKKERKNDEVYSSLLLSSSITSSSFIYRPHELRVKSVVSASVSLGQFYRYLVRIHHGTQNDAEIQIPFNTTTKKKVKRNERRAKRALL